MDNKQYNEIKRKVFKENMNIAIVYVLLQMCLIISVVITFIFYSKIALTITLVLLMLCLYLRFILNRSVKRIKQEITSFPLNEE